MAFGISVSRSGSFKEALNSEIQKTVDAIYGEHCEYLPPEKIERRSIEDLVRQIMSYTQNKRLEANDREWNQIQSKSLHSRALVSGLTHKGVTTLSTASNQSPNKFSIVSPPNQHSQAQHHHLNSGLQQQHSSQRDGFFGKRDNRSNSPTRVEEEVKFGKKASSKQRAQSALTNDTKAHFNSKSTAFPASNQPSR